MKSLFNADDRAELLTRIGNVKPASTRLWGKMTPAQMLTHCYRVLETGAGISPRKQAFLGKIIMPFIRTSIVGEKPFSRNSPTDPTFVVSDARDLDAERKRLLEVIDIFVARGPEAAGTQTHSFFGKLSGEEWGTISWKHLDHHLRQFGV